jgi:hypothetical protein
MKFIITVDTEADNQWKRGGIALKNIDYLPRFQALCQRYDFTPTYLVAYEIASNQKAVSMLKRWYNQGKAEIGAHLHPWTTPPFKSEEERKARVFPNELTDEELKLKLKNLTDKITESFGAAPTSFRAGRWGFDRRLVDYLPELGYLVDCSITPKVSWKKFKGAAGGIGGPDFREAPVKPYYISRDNVCRPGDSKLLEVPMTILYTGRLIKEGGKIANWFSVLDESILKRGLNFLFFKRKWLRIFPETSGREWEAIYNSAKRNRLPVLEFMIHSSELMPGGSPYAKNGKDVENIYKNLEIMFAYFKRNNLKGMALSELPKI